MARIAKSLPAPDQGYPHRDHRSKKGREENQPFKRYLRKRRLHQKYKPKGARKGKWIV